LVVHDMPLVVRHDGVVVTAAGLRQCRIFAAPHGLAEVFNPGVRSSLRVSRVHGAFGKMSKEESPRSPPTKKGKFQEDAGRKIIPYVKTWALITLHNDFANLHPKQML